MEKEQFKELTPMDMLNEFCESHSLEFVKGYLEALNTIIEILREKIKK